MQCWCHCRPQRTSGNSVSVHVSRRPPVSSQPQANLLSNDLLSEANEVAADDDDDDDADGDGESARAVGASSVGVRLVDEDDDEDEDDEDADVGLLDRAVAAFVVAVDGNSAALELKCIRTSSSSASSSK